MTAEWRPLTLGEVIQLEYGKPLAPEDRSPVGRYPAYGANGEKDRTDRFYRDHPSIIVGRKGSAGEITLTEEKYWPLDVTYFAEFDRQRYDLKFLYHLLLSLDLRTLAKGVKPGINRSEVYAIPVSVPELHEQRRIVAILDEAFEGIATAKAHAEKNLRNARELLEVALQSFVGQAHDGIHLTTLGAVCNFVGGAQPPKSDFIGEPREGYIRLIQIRDYKSDKKAVYIPKSLARRFCTADDVMIGRYGPPLFQILRGIEGAYNVALMKAVPDEAVLSKGYLFHSLRQRDVLNHVIASSARAAGQIGLTKETIEPYPIYLPDLDVQAAIVSRIEQFEDATQSVVQNYEEKLTALDELKQSLLHQAFSGQL
jgi:type I restriction enzyme S subunit